MKKSLIIRRLFLFIHFLQAISGMEKVCNFAAWIITNPKSTKNLIRWQKSMPCWKNRSVILRREDVTAPSKCCRCVERRNPKSKRHEGIMIKKGWWCRGANFGLYFGQVWSKGKWRFLARSAACFGFVGKQPLSRPSRAFVGSKVEAIQKCRSEPSEQNSLLHQERHHQNCRFLGHSKGAKCTSK